PQADVVAVLWDRSLIVVVVHQPGLIRQREVGEQVLRDAINPAGGDDVSLERLARFRVVNLHGSARLNAFSQISLSLQFARDGFNCRIRIAVTRAGIAQKEECRGVLDDLRDQQRSADYQAETRLRVRGLRDVLTSDGKRLGIQRGVIQRKRSHSVYLIGLAAV